MPGEGHDDSDDEKHHGDDDHDEHAGHYNHGDENACLSQPYILKVKKSADSTFQTKKICGKSA